MQFNRQIIVGVVFDISMQHHADSRRYIDIIKESLVRFAVKLGLNCGVYVAHPDNHTMPRLQGESVHSIVSYKEEIGFKVYPALAQCLDMISANEADEKYVVLLTDRYKTKSKYQYEKVSKLNESRQKGCKFLFVGIGNRYDHESFAELGGIHVSDPNIVGEKMIELTGVK